jgi:hypothetical protein
MDTTLLSWIGAFLGDHPVVSVQGHPHSGKTTFAISIITYILTKLKDNESSCVWFQASEQFPVKRLNSLYDGSELNGLLKKFFIIPRQTCMDYACQKIIIRSILEESLLIPPDTCAIVIDNISHFLRFELQMCEDAKGRAAFLNSYFDEELFPLIMFCKREGINTGETVPFFKSLYSRIDALNIDLRNNFGREFKTMKISYNGFKQEYNYRINSSGLNLI